MNILMFSPTNQTRFTEHKFFKLVTLYCHLAAIHGNVQGSKFRFWDYTPAPHLKKIFFPPLTVTVNYYLTSTEKVQTLLAHSDCCHCQFFFIFPSCLISWVCIANNLECILHIAHKIIVFCANEDIFFQAVRGSCVEIPEDSLGLTFGHH